jgi:hypothetical protein
MPGFRAYHPQSSDVITSRMFVAWGAGRMSHELRGLLFDEKGVKIRDGIPLPTTRCWALQFMDVPPASNYRLMIRSVATGALQYVAEEITVAPGRGIRISYPTDPGDFPVDIDFVSYGTTDQIGTHTASLNPSSGTITLLYGPPSTPDGWAFSFDGVTPGDPILRVEGGGSHDTQQLIVREID